MDKNIFKIFTQENGIIITREFINIIKESVSTDDDIKKLVKLYLIEYGNKRINLEQLEELIRKNRGDEEKMDYEVTRISYKSLKEIERYRIIKRKTKYNISQISSLKEDSSSIFGCLYKDFLGKYTLEDDTGTIEVDTKKILDDFFLFNYMYVGFHGTKENNKFIAASAFLPQISPLAIDYKQNGAKKFTKIFFIKGFIAKETLETIISSKETTIVVLIGPFYDLKNSVLPFMKNENYNVVIIPDMKDFLIEEDNFHCHVVPQLNLFEENKDLDNSHKSDIKKDNVVYSTNPCFIDIYGSKIFISSISLFEYKKNGDFIGKNYVKSFIRSYVSQYDVNPFSPPHIHYDITPNVYVICQEHMQFEEIIDDIRFVSLPKFEEDLIFLEYDLQTFRTNLRKYKSSSL